MNHIDNYEKINADETLEKIVDDLVEEFCELPPEKRRLGFKLTMTQFQDIDIYRLVNEINRYLEVGAIATDDDHFVLFDRETAKAMYEVIHGE